jgi:hypothetical protein
LSAQRIQVAINGDPTTDLRALLKHYIFRVLKKKNGA